MNLRRLIRRLIARFLAVPSPGGASPFDEETFIRAWHPAYRQSSTRARRNSR